MLTIWDRVFTADWFRIVPMPGILTAFHLSDSTGLRRRTVVSGLVVAIVVTMVVSFFSFLSTAYYAGGAGAFGWFFDTHPTEEFSRLSHTVARVDAWKNRETLERKNGGRIPTEEIPEVARPDFFHIAWIAGGAIAATLFALLRRYLFWWPHPAGYVMWMAYWPHRSMWFSFFLGWILKAGIAKYGGFRINALARRFFIGLVVGEALAAILWTVIAWLTDHRSV